MSSHSGSCRIHNQNHAPACPFALSHSSRSLSQDVHYLPLSSRSPSPSISPTAANRQPLSDLLPLLALHLYSLYYHPRLLISYREGEDIDFFKTLSGLFIDSTGPGSCRFLDEAWRSVNRSGNAFVRIRSRICIYKEKNSNMAGAFPHT